MDNADVIARIAEIQRRQKLLGTLEQNNLSTPIQGAGKGNAYGQLAAKLATAFMLKGANENLAADDTSARRDYGTQLTGEANKYLDTFNGRPGQTMSDADVANLFQRDQNPPQMTSAAEPMQANPRAAIVNAMASQLPEIQQLGKAGLSGLQKQQVNPLDYLKLDPTFSAASRVAAANGGGAAVLQAAPKFTAVADQLVQEPTDGTSQPRVAGDFRTKYGAPTQLGGAFVQTAPDTGQVKEVVGRPPSVSVSLNPTIAGEDSFAKKLGEGVAGEYQTARDAAVAGYKSLGLVNQLRKVDASGIFNSPVPNASIRIGQFASALGLPVDGQRLANSETYQQLVAKQVANAVLTGSAARSMTDKDREAYQQSLVQMLSSPQGRQQVYAQMENNAKTDIARNQSFQEQLKNNPRYKDFAGMLTMNPVDQNPAPGVVPPQAPTLPVGQTSDAPIPLADWLKSKGH